MEREKTDSYGFRPHLSPDTAKPQLIELMDMGDMVHPEMPEQLLEHNEVTTAKGVQINE